MQNLHELYKIQSELKERIGYNGPDKFEKMMLAMIVEFTEAANDWQGFKYWKKNNKPKETLLEEYIDGLHFVLETGLDIQEMGFIELPEVIEPMKNTMIDSITELIKELIHIVLNLETDVILGLPKIEFRYKTLFAMYLGLGEMLGFTEDQIAVAYLKKVAINHDRQDNGY